MNLIVGVNLAEIERKTMTKQMLIITLRDMVNSRQDILFKIRNSKNIKRVQKELQWEYELVEDKIEILEKELDDEIC